MNAERLQRLGMTLLSVGVILVVFGTSTPVLGSLAALLAITLIQEQFLYTRSESTKDGQTYIDAVRDASEKPPPSTPSTQTDIADIEASTPTHSQQSDTSASESLDHSLNRDDDWVALQRSEVNDGSTSDGKDVSLCDGDAVANAINLSKVIIDSPEGAVSTSAPAKDDQDQPSSDVETLEESAVDIKPSMTLQGASASANFGSDCSTLAEEEVPEAFPVKKNAPATDGSNVAEIPVSATEDNEPTPPAITDDQLSILASSHISFVESSKPPSVHSHNSSTLGGNIRKKIKTALDNVSQPLSQSADAAKRIRRKSVHRLKGVFVPPSVHTVLQGQGADGVTGEAKERNSIDAIRSILKQGNGSDPQVQSDGEHEVKKEPESRPSIRTRTMSRLQKRKSIANPMTVAADSQLENADEAQQRGNPETTASLGRSVSYTNKGTEDDEKKQDDEHSKSSLRNRTMSLSWKRKSLMQMFDDGKEIQVQE